MSNLRWQFTYSIVRLTSSILVVPLLLALGDTHDVLLYGYVAFITALTVGLDLGLQSVSIARISNAFRNSRDIFDELLFTLRRIYLFLSSVAFLILLTFYFIGTVNSKLSFNDVYLLFAHAVFSIVNLRFMWQDALYIGTERLGSLRKIQSISLLWFLVFFFGLLLISTPVLSFVFANGISIIVSRITIQFKSVGRFYSFIPNGRESFNILIFKSDFVHVLPASLVALLAGRIFYYIGLTRYDDTSSTLFVTMISILSMTNFVAMIYKDSKAFELTKDMNLVFPVLLKSILVQFGIFVISYLTLFGSLDYLALLRPELSSLDILTGSLFYLLTFFESIAGIISLVLLNRKKFKYVKWFIIVMLIQSTMLSFLSSFGLYSLDSLLLIVSLFWLVYCLILVRLFYAQRKD